MDPLTELITKHYGLSEKDARALTDEVFNTPNTDIAKRAEAISNRNGKVLPSDAMDMTPEEYMKMLGAVPTFMEGQAVEDRIGESNKKWDKAFAEAKAKNQLLFKPMAPYDITEEKDLGKNYEESLWHNSTPIPQGPPRGTPETGPLPIPGSPDHPTEKNWGFLADFVKQHGWQPELFKGRSYPDAMNIMAKQLEAERMRKMGTFDPSNWVGI